MCKDYIDPTGHFLGSLFAWVGKVVVGGIVNAVVDTGIRLLTGQEVSLKTIGSSFVEGCVASAIGTGTAKLASKVTSAAGKYAINKAGGAAARTAVGVVRGDSAKDIARSVGVGFLADNVLDGVFSKISKIRTQKANAKAASTKPNTNSGNRTVKSGRAKNKLKPDQDAKGAHTTFKYNNKGQISNYATWYRNLRNPNGFFLYKRVDLYQSHNGIIPHVHVGSKVRYPFPHEIPLSYKRRK